MGRAGLLFVVLALLLAAAATPARAAVVDDDPAIAALGSGDMRLFVRGTDGALWTRSWNGSSWSGWSSLGGTLTSGPTAMATPNGTYDVFVRGPEDAYYHKHFTPAGGWSEWGRLPDGRYTSAPAATYRQGTGEIDVLGVGYNNQLYHRAWVPGSGWSPPGSLGGSVSGRPSAISPAASILDVYLPGADGQLFQINWTSSAGWSGFIPLGGNLTSGVAATSWEAGRRDIYARGVDNGIHGRPYQTDHWGGWGQLGGFLTSGPAATPLGPGRLYLVARAYDQIVAQSYDNGWSGWQNLGRAPLWPAPAPPPAPTPEGELRLRAGIGCIPRGGRVPVRVSVRRRTGRRAPRVIKVVFSVNRNKLRRTDRKKPYKTRIRVRFKAGTKHRVYARIHYRRAGSKTVRRKTVSKRFSMCR